MSLWWVAVAIIFSAQADSFERKRVVFVFDASGSMADHGQVQCNGRGCPAEPVSGGRKIKRASEIAQQLDRDYSARDYLASLMVFGQGDCSAIDVLVDFEHRLRSVTSIATSVRELVPFGLTPLSESIRRAGEHLTRYGDPGGEIVVVTDGMESCRGSPKKVAAELFSKHGIRTNIIGLHTPDYVNGELKGIAKSGGGWFRREEFGFDPNTLPAPDDQPIEEGGASAVSFAPEEQERPQPPQAPDPLPKPPQRAPAEQRAPPQTTVVMPLL